MLSFIGLKYMNLHKHRWLNAHSTALQIVNGIVLFNPVHNNFVAH